jgi:hypothetical protein
MTTEMAVTGLKVMALFMAIITASSNMEFLVSKSEDISVKNHVWLASSSTLFIYLQWLR